VVCLALITHQAIFSYKGQNEKKTWNKKGVHLAVNSRARPLQFSMKLIGPEKYFVASKIKQTNPCLFKSTATRGANPIH